MSNSSPVVHFSNPSVGARGVVHAHLHLRVPDLGAFPSEGWTDFASIVLAWWSESLARVLEGQSTPETFNFMDGPFEFELDASEGVDRARISLSEVRSSGLRVVGRSVIDLSNLAAAVLDCAKSCCRQLKTAKVSNSDREMLERGIDKLRHALAVQEQARL